MHQIAHERVACVATRTTGPAHDSARSRARAALIALPLALGSIAADVGRAHAACNLFPRAITTFRSAQGSTNRPFAAPGEFVEIKLRPSVCDASGAGFDPALGDRVTLLFTPPDGPRNAVVLSTDCSFFSPAVETGCTAALGGGSTATCIEIDPSVDMKFVAGLGDETRLQVRFPLVDVAAGTCSGGGNDGRVCRAHASCAGGTCTGLTGGNRTLSGPTKIVVTDDASPLACDLASSRCASSLATPGLVACVDEYFEVDGTCRTSPLLIDSTFGGFTTLPPPNDYQALCIDPSPPCTGTATEARLTTDRDGNLLLPMDWRGILVKANQVPVPRLLRGSTPLEAFTGLPDPIFIPSGEFTGSFTPEGVKLPPIFEPQVADDPAAANEATLFGSADAPYTILRVARRSPTFSECSAGCDDGGNACSGRPCTADGDCPGSACEPTTCVGGANAGDECLGDAGCPGGQCGAGSGLFDLSDRYASSIGPVIVTRFTMGMGVCETGGNEGDVCSDSGQCGGDNCVGYRIEAQDPVPLEGLAGTDQAFSFTARESIVGSDLNGDMDVRDTAIRLQARSTGLALPIGPLAPGGQVQGRSVVRIQSPPFSFPAVAIENDIVAFLEPEPNAPEPRDLNGNGEIFDTILRVLQTGSDAASDLLGGVVVESEAEPHIDGRSLRVSNGRVFFRQSERSTGAWETFRASVATDGTQANDFSQPVSLAMSRDARFVVFQSVANNLVVPDNGAGHDVFVRSLLTDTTERVSRNSLGVQANLGTAVSQGAISADGRFVAFYSGSSNLIPFDANGGGFSDAFLHDRQTGATELVSQSSAGIQGDLSSYRVFLAGMAISGDGRFVAFHSSATNLVPGDTNTCATGPSPGECQDVFVRDRLLQTTVRANVSSSGAEANELSLGRISISDDGRIVAFDSRASNLVDGDLNAFDDVFVRDLDSGTTQRVSVSHLGGELAVGGSLHGMSADGRYVLFHSSNNAVPGRIGPFIYDRRTGHVEAACEGLDGTGCGSALSSIALSADGRFVVFTAAQEDIVAEDSNGIGDVFLRDRLTGLIKRVSVKSDGEQPATGNPNQTALPFPVTERRSRSSARRRISCPTTPTPAACSRFPESVRTFSFDAQAPAAPMSLSTGVSTTRSPWCWRLLRLRPRSLSRFAQRPA